MKTQALAVRATPYLALGSLLILLSGLAPGQVTSRVSVASGGGQGNGGSYSPALSVSGRYVAFYSDATDLVPGDTNGVTDVFLRDRLADTTRRLSVATDGTEADGASSDPVISADGQLVAFHSHATNLVPGDTNELHDVFVHHVPSGTTTRVSVHSLGVQGNGASWYPTMSADGNRIAFYSYASNLVGVDNNWCEDVFVHDLGTGRTQRISVADDGSQANARSLYASLSADGRRVSFESEATNLAPGGQGPGSDVFVRDLELGTTVCVSAAPDGGPGNGGCGYASISGDGRRVAFGSGSSNLVPGDTNGLTDVFVHDLGTGTTVRASVGSHGEEGNGISQVHLGAAFSFHGRYLTFKSYADTLVPGDTNGYQDVFVRDLLSGRTARVNLAPGGQQSTGNTSQPSITRDGRQVAFYSSASNLVAGDTNGVPDAFVVILHR